ncbi:Thioredoxin/glutathione peroxidase BtuE [Pleomorphomonas sp. T1.2MG-36]|uniref:glutathione peroxidase n=1 Tax=Pleomorphomonas sp. T1.2MG-36 TaxID=3041167 RepID=UPI002477A684|nr:glutathione peroxidase [Pleomorphomonas sp. T1.2MG-36]CAI9416667.1 Thioredoxin/glutathione peroxidase BtuE [Pleomorphomonas sp. T1.2MG-36]
MTTTLFDTPLATLDGVPTTLKPWLGKVLLVVNTASKCGLTPQYEVLVNLYQRFKDRGFEVLGFPANDFAGQEPGSNEEIATFCSTTFGVDFPMFAKIAVTGPDKHPLYKTLIAEKPEARTLPGTDFRAALRGHGITPTEAPEVLWNFEKFLIGRDGKVIDRFSPDTAPDADIIVAAIEKAL